MESQGRFDREQIISGDLQHCSLAFFPKLLKNIKKHKKTQNHKMALCGLPSVILFSISPEIQNLLKRCYLQLFLSQNLHCSH